MENKQKNIKIAFSDESGVWADGPYYVRSWILWNFEDYIILEKKFLKTLDRRKHLLHWKDKKLRTDLSEKEQNEIFKSIDNLYVTFTITNGFKDKKLKVRDDVQNLLNNHPSLKGKNYERYLIDNVGKAVNKTFFLYIYESVHFRSFLSKLDSSSLYFLILDTPSQLDPEQHKKIWENSYSEEDNMKLIISYENDEYSLGLQVAHCFASATNDFLSNKGGDDFLEKWKEKFFDKRSISKIMWEGDQDYQLEAIKKINKFFTES
ncbi:MAG: hypothetical protein ACPLYC_00990 [Minisyncoccia bacterium]